MKFLAKILLPSIRAAAFDGPNTLMPAASSFATEASASVMPGRSKSAHEYISVSSRNSSKNSLPRS